MKLFQKIKFYLGKEVKINQKGGTYVILHKTPYGIEYNIYDEKGMLLFHWSRK